MLPILGNNRLEMFSKSVSHRIVRGFLIASAILSFLFPAPVSAGFVFGICPEDNDYLRVLDLEKRQGAKFGSVSFIFDGFSIFSAFFLWRAVSVLGKDRIYHVAVSPMGMTAKQVADGEFDFSYRLFFRTVKFTGAKFVFRTMHEMNGSWFSWSGDPESFKKAWIRAHGISRAEGVGPWNVQFDFSVNRQDLPSTNRKMGGTIVSCTAAASKKMGCPRFEDFYPGSAFVDVVWMSAYNFGRSLPTAWSSWQTFQQLIDDSQFHTYSRLKALQKPILIDETGTTAVKFSGKWSRETALEKYRNSDEDKNLWIEWMAKTASERPEIVLITYFNRDRTRGLTTERAGEADWAVFPPESPKTYRAASDLLVSASGQTGGIAFAEPPASEKSWPTLVWERIASYF